MSYINAIESKLASLAREGQAYSVSFQGSTSTSAYGVMLDPGSLNMIIDHIIVSASRITSANTHFKWGFNDNTSGYSAATAVESNLKSDGSAAAITALVDVAAAVGPTRQIGTAQMNNETGSQAGATALVIPIGAYLDAADYFVVVCDTDVAVEITVTIVAYNADA